MTKSIPERFEKWLATKGMKKKITTAEGTSVKPVQPLSPRTVKNYMSNWRMIMKVLGYMDRDEHTKVWKVLPGVDWSAFDIEKVASWLHQKFDGELTDQDKTNWNNYCKVLRKFGEFMFYEYRPRGQPGFSSKKLARLQEATILFSITSGRTIDINSPRKAHAFARWLMDHQEEIHKKYGQMVWAGQWLGLRYEELVRIPKNLDGPSLKVKFDNRWCVVWGKGRFGKKDRDIPLSQNASTFLKDLMEERAKIEADTDRMFTTYKGKAFNDYSSNGFNARLKKYAQEYNDQLTNKSLQLDLKLVKSHSIMRHVFGTHYGSKLSAEELMEYMGITRYKVVRKYINYSDREKINKFDRINGNEIKGPVPAVSSNGFVGGLEDLKARAGDIFPEKSGAIVKLLEAVEELIS